MHKPTELRYRSIIDHKLKRAFEKTYDWLRENATSIDENKSATHPVFYQECPYESSFKRRTNLEPLLYSFYKKDNFVAANIHIESSSRDQLLGERTADGEIEFFAQIDRYNSWDCTVVALRGNTPIEVKQKVARMQQHFGI